MRYLIVLICLVYSTCSFGQGWDSYTNARFGASADVPPGFFPAGPEANNSDGLIFRSADGGLLTIYGADVPGRDFEAKIQAMMTHEHSYNGWPIVGSKITPDWAEFWGNHGSRQLRVRVLSACNGKHVVVTRFEFNSGQERSVDRVENSLKSGLANAC